MTPRYFDIGKIKEFCCAFAEYIQATGQLSALSTGENHGLTYGEMFEKFVSGNDWKSLYPANFHNELKEVYKELELVVKNNNDLKDEIEKLQLKAQ